jgi:SecD/SecF fusion protein
MNRRNILHVVIIAVTLILSAYFLYPSYVYYFAKTQDQRDEVPRTTPLLLKKIFNLGLDLQGGMRMVLEIDRSKVDVKEAKGERDLLDIAYTVIENRVNGLGVAEPSIQKQGRDRLIVELPGLKDEVAARNVIGKTAQLEFKLLRDVGQLEHAVNVIDNTLKGKLGAGDSTKADTAADTAKTKETKEMADQLFAGSELKKDSAKTADTAATADTAGEKITSFRDLLARVGDQIGAVPENKHKVELILQRKDVREALERAGLGGNQFLWSHDTTVYDRTSLYTLYYLKSTPEMNGSALKDASAAMDQSGMRGGGSLVNLELNPKGARKFSSVTGANVNKMLAIVLDSVVYSAPRIIQKISGGRAEITGSFSMDEARDLAIVLRAGALPAPVRVIEERSVGPSLGQDSIKMGINAGIIASLAIIIFMLFYYRMSGLYANIALILNLIFTLAVMAGLNATLTLPGICGLVLNLGVAVDANVLICERIREELALGKTARSAIEMGYKRVFVVIFDSNLTMMLKALILLWIGTGPIKGFAVTLILGLIISMFTSLFMTHVMYNFFTGKTQAKLSI